MNKLTKITKVGCSALCGSLAAISAASAGDLSVTGGADVTWMSNGGDNTGNPLGMASAVTFKGSGELDNGWTFGLAIAHGDADVYSATTVDITMGGLGNLEFDQGNSGNGIAAYDNVMPTAWEEAHGAGLSGGVKTVLGAGASDNFQYTTPVLNEGSWGTTIAITVAPDYGTSDTADKTTANSEDANGAAYDLTIKMNPSMGTEILSGLNLYIGASVVEHYANSGIEEDAYEGVGAITYALGPVEIGAMVSGNHTGEETGHVYNFYKNQGYGVAFNVNDSLSVSYGEYKTRKEGYNGSQAQLTGEKGRVAEVTSWQAAYTMGGASWRIAEVNAENVLFNPGDEQNATIVSMSLAF
jgi:outer membrane protein OmpU